MRKLFLISLLTALFFSDKALAQYSDPDLPVQVNDHSGIVQNRTLIVGYELSADNWLSLYWDLNHAGLQEFNPLQEVILDDAFIHIDLSPNISLLRLKPEAYILPVPKDFRGHSFPYGYSIRLKPGEFYMPQISQQYHTPDRAHEPTQISTTLDHYFGTCYVQEYRWNDILPSYILKIYGLKSHGTSYQLPGVFMSWEASHLDRSTGVLMMDIQSSEPHFREPLDIRFDVFGDDYRLLKTVTKTYSPADLQNGIADAIDFQMTISDDEYVVIEGTIDPSRKIVDRHDFFESSWNDAHFGVDMKAQGIPYLSEEQGNFYRGDGFQLNQAECRIDQNGIGIAYDTLTGASIVPLDFIYRFYTPEFISVLKQFYEKEAAMMDLEFSAGVMRSRGASDLRSAIPGQIKAVHWMPSVMGMKSNIKNLEEEKNSVLTFSRWQALYEGKGDSFFDVSAEDWYASLVQKAKSSGIVQGKADNAGNLLFQFSPNDAVSKAELLKMAYLASGLSPAIISTGSFHDHWASAFWNDALTRSLTLVQSGAPDDIIKRKDAVQFMVELLGIPLEQDLSVLTSYSDVPKDSPLGKFVYTALMRGAITQRDQFQPEVTLNRAEQLAFIYQFLKAIGQ